jgi:TolB-like protein
VTPGALYADEIIRSINGDKALVVVLSQSAVASPHVGKEVERASSKRRPIITLKTDAAPLTNALEYFLSEAQWVDLASDGTKVAFAKIVSAVHGEFTANSVVEPSHRGRAPQTATDRSSRLPAAVQSNRRFSRPAVLSVTLTALVVGYLAVDRLLLSKHQTAETLVTVAAPAAPSFNPPPHSIAVLPFVNMSGDAKQDYFSDGISEELLDSLSRLNELQVAARTSSFSFKGQNVDVSTIAHKLNVGAILEGSVRRSGKTVRITVQLIDAVSGFHVSSETYDRTLSDTLKVQTEVATSVAEKLKIRMSAYGSEQLSAGSANNAEAYDAYLRGVQLYAKAHTDQSAAIARSSLAEFDRAVSLDPEFAQAYAKRADARRFDEARVTLTDATILDPASRLIAGTKANLLLACGEVDSAVRHCESRDAPLDQWARSACLALAYHASGRRFEAEGEL